MSVPFSNLAASVVQQEIAHLRKYWFLMLLLGIASIAVGIIAISHTCLASVFSVMVLGWLLLIQGGVEVAHGILVRNWRGFALHLVAAVLYLLAGLFIVQEPVQATAVLTLLIAAMFFAGGIVRIIFSMTTRFRLWGWVLLTGIVDLILGWLIFSKWPESSLFFIGLFVGIELLFNGWSWVMLALAVRTAEPGKVA